ncbi:MAG: response regulator transcription factor [Alphaproteobacteria bacterium]|nr:response regulator transcription factor [Alphaproteobacteria bacterium]MBL6940188.1 response regulator transcription factor [Alphaproteobacteria bacterium]MBL7100274.1 response regulator transcription factor [Alphaproteobacteria bacterium]
MARLLIVEDNEEFARLLAGRLRAAGHTVSSAALMTEARHWLDGGQFDAVILDLALPDGDGLTLLRSLRDTGNPTPVLALTARNTIRERVEGLSAGADDYLGKPFDFDELQARLLAILRRPNVFVGRTISVGNIVYDTVARQVLVNGKAQVLSAREVTVLELLMRRAGRVVLKSTVEETLYGDLGDVTPNAVEVCVHRLRKQLSRAEATANVHAVRNLGYLIRELPS